MRLTARERQLLDAAANGNTDRQISDDLAISIETVSSYWRGIRLKFQASSRTECVARYSEQKSASLVVKHELESGELLKEIKIRTEAQARELAQKNVLQAITEASLAYITGNSSLKECFENLLESVLNLSLSEYGFIGEVLYEDGKPYLKEHALSNIAWSPETVALYEQFHAEGLEFRNLKTLLGEVMLTGKTVIANDPPSDNRANGTPEGHPALLAFLGIPVFRGQELIGMIGLGNRAGGYDQQVVDELAPVIATCANFITGYRLEQERKVMLQQIANSREVVRNLVDRIPAGIVYETPERKVEFVNETFIKMFGLNAKPSQLVGRSCTDESLVGRSLLVDPVKFDVGFINASTATESILKEAFDLVDGRRLERDCIVVESNGAVRGYLWCYRDITRTTRTRTTDNLEPIDPMSYI